MNVKTEMFALCCAMQSFQAYFTDKKKKKESFPPIEFMAEIARLLETLMCLIFSCLEQEKVGQESCPKKMQWNCFYFVEIVNSVMENVIKKKLKQKEWLCEIAKLPLGENKS